MAMRVVDWVVNLTVFLNEDKALELITNSTALLHLSGRWQTIAVSWPS